jgi:hypothetical protein
VAAAAPACPAGWAAGTGSVRASGTGPVLVTAAHAAPGPLGHRPAIRSLCGIRGGVPAASSAFTRVKPVPARYRRALAVTARAPNGGYFACPGFADSTERDRRRPQEAGRNAKCLVSGGAGRCARAMEISPSWGNFPRLRVQVLGHSNSPPRGRLGRMLPFCVWCFAQSPDNHW